MRGVAWCAAAGGEAMRYYLQILVDYIRVDPERHLTHVMIAALVGWLFGTWFGSNVLGPGAVRVFVRREAWKGVEAALDKHLGRMILAEHEPGS